MQRGASWHRVVQEHALVCSLSSIFFFQRGPILSIQQERQHAFFYRCQYIPKRAKFLLRKRMLREYASI